MKTTIALLTVSLSQLLQAQDSITLQLKWWNQFQFAGYYAAQKEGYYKAEGLDVNIVPGGIGIAPVEEVTSGRAQFGIGGSDLILDYSNGKPLAAVGALFQHSPYTFMTLEESKINSLNDFVNKTVMACDGQGWAELKAALILEGINDDSVHVIKHTWNNNDLITGKVDVISAYCTVEPMQLSEQGYKPHLIRPINYGIDFYGDVLFTTTKMMENNPEIIVKFRNASFRGWEYALTHKEEMINYILTLPGVKERGVTRAQLMNEANAMQKLILADVVEIGHMNEGRWQHILNTYKMLGLSDSQSSMAGFVFDPEKEQVAQHSRTLKYTSAAVLLLALIVTISFYRFRKTIRENRERLKHETSCHAEVKDKLNTTEEFLDLAVKGAGIGVWSYHVQSGHFTFNSIGKTMIGYNSEDVTIQGSSLLELMHPSDRELIMQSFNAHITGNSNAFEGNMRFRTMNGDWKWIHAKANAQSRDETGNATRIKGIQLDIDEIKKKETELIEISKELLRNNTDLRQFSFAVSHSIRAPLASIAGLLQIADNNLKMADQSAILVKIEKSVHQLMETLNDINSILTSRQPDGKVGAFIPVQDRIKCIISLHQDNLTAISATVNFTTENKHTIWFPTEIFDGIVNNLVSNAIKFRHPDRNLSLEFALKETENFVVISITDNGQGLDLEKFGNKIFGLYQRFHPKTAGKGLGLYTTKVQIEGMGGKLEVSSQLHKGSTFTVFLPKAPHCYIPEDVASETKSL